MSEENSNLYTTMVSNHKRGAPGMVGHRLPKSALWIRVITRDNRKYFLIFPNIP